ncbi:hypothetical protein B0H19DRAFT_1256643 [Mycena capillaripes]|nr:hypothetical protein B0H19DRAFT_1256643 [Mycena capillaripes]
MSTPLQKPLLLPGIAPHLFQSRRAHKTVKFSPSYRRSVTMPQPSSTDQTTSAHNKHPSDISMNSDYLARRTAEALTEAQAGEIALLRASVASLTSHAQTTTNLYHETQRQLMRAIIHLNTLITVYAESGNERGLEGAMTVARNFIQEYTNHKLDALL